VLEEDHFIEEKLFVQHQSFILLDNVG